MHYLDNAATTRVYPEAALRSAHIMDKIFANPSSQHAMGHAARDELRLARESVAAAIGGGAEGVIFTSGGTEANNQALLSALHAARRVGRHIITTGAEHPSILEYVKSLPQSEYEITYLKTRRFGAVDPVDLAAALRPDTAVVSAMLVNNETGAVNPIAELRQVVREAGCSAIFHTDAVQALCKVPIDVKTLGVDLLTLSGHKIHGPKGVGALYIRPGLRGKALLAGGGQEGGLRSGTENLPSIAAFGEACRIGLQNFAENTEKIAGLRKYLEERLESADFCARINFSGASHIASICLFGCKSEVTARILSDRGVYVSAGSACSKGRRSYVLTACGLTADEADCTIRVSLGVMNEREDIDALTEGLAAVYARFHK